MVGRATHTVSLADERAAASGYCVPIAPRLSGTNGDLPEGKRHVEATFAGAKNMADAIDKMASVAVAFGFGDPTGATLTVAAVVSVSSKSVAAVSAALAEIAKNPKHSTTNRTMARSAV